MLACVLSAALSAIAPGSATADVNGIEPFPVEVEVNSGWGDTVVLTAGLPDVARACRRLMRASPSIPTATLGRNAPRHAATRKDSPRRL